MAAGGGIKPGVAPVAGGAAPSGWVMAGGGGALFNATRSLGECPTPKAMAKITTRNTAAAIHPQPALRPAGSYPTLPLIGSFESR